MAASKAYFLNRLSNFADPDPAMSVYVLILTPVYLLIVSVSVTTWGMLVAYFKWRVFIVNAIAMGLNAITLWYLQVGKDFDKLFKGYR